MIQGMIFDFDGTLVDSMPTFVSCMLRILDENGNVAPYAQLPVHLTLEGDAQLVGPAVVTAEGGMTGTYVRSIGRAGEARLTIHTEQTEDVTLIFRIHAQ